MSVPFLDSDRIHLCTSYVSYHDTFSGKKTEMSTLYSFAKRYNSSAYQRVFPFSRRLYCVSERLRYSATSFCVNPLLTRNALGDRYSFMLSPPIFFLCLYMTLLSYHSQKTKSTQKDTFFKKNIFK